jgi:hypothetical protein
LPNHPWHLQAILYDTTDLSSQNLTFYDTQQTATGQPFIDLNQYNFADKAAMVILKAGDLYVPGDQLVLLDQAQLNNTDTWTLDPLTGGVKIDSWTVSFNLNNINAADKAAGIRFIINGPPGPFS